MLRAAILVITVLVLALLAACGGEDPKPAGAATQQVASAVERLEALTRRRQFSLICSQLFTPAARRRAGGRECAKQLAEAGDEVRSPRIDLVSVTIRGDRALAKVRTSARGQAPVEDEIELVRVRGGYRIEALTS